MFKIFICLLSILFIFSCNKSQYNNLNLDFSGIDEFWKITSILSNNIDPEERNWHALFNTPGYSALTQSEFSQAYFKRYFRFAYMPNKSDSLKEELAKSHWRIQYLNHMTKVLLKKEEIQNHQKELFASNYLTNESLDLTRKYLPADALMSGDLPPISFVVFGNDARSYSTIVIDILYSIEQGDKLKYLVGHEAHHFYRNKTLTFNFPDVNQSDYNIVWAINQIQAEGIADQIDKRVRFFDSGDIANSKWALKYKEYLQSTPALIIKMDSLLVQYGTQSEDLISISEKFRSSIPMSGHPTGYFMTNAIIENLGKSELLKNLGNPFEFFRLYNHVAESKSEKYPVFSEKSKELINNLELNYSKM